MRILRPQQRARPRWNDNSLQRSCYCRTSGDHVGRKGNHSRATEPRARCETRQRPSYRWRRLLSWRDTRG